jgi:PBP1b-binding outer membrane lipoprotein LpoB
MKYLISILISALLLGGCTAGRLSLNDKINDTTVKSSGAPPATENRSGPLSTKQKTTSAATAEPIEASFNETAYLDRF